MPAIVWIIYLNRTMLAASAAPLDRADRACIVAYPPEFGFNQGIFGVWRSRQLTLTQKKLTPPVTRSSRHNPSRKSVADRSFPRSGKRRMRRGCMVFERLSRAGTMTSVAIGVAVGESRTDLP
jgi:hypothetical protein